jgi:uncharacterized protein (DUF305 family)
MDGDPRQDPAYRATLLSAFGRQFSNFRGTVQYLKEQTMQINVDKKTGALVAVIVVLLAVILGISINRNNDEGLMGMHDNDSMGMHHNSGTATYTGADVMFLQMMIPHHQQAIDISNIALKTSKDSELLALANTIIKAQTAEIVQMKTWLNDAGATTDMGHSMSGMGGMLDDAELSALSAASGKNFDLLWLKGMIGHHDGAIHMTTMIRDASNPDIKTFGENVVMDQSAQIVQMNAMLKRIG